MCPQQGLLALNYSWASLYVHTARQQVANTAWTSESRRQIPHLHSGKRLPSFPGIAWSHCPSVPSVGDLTFTHYCPKEPGLTSPSLFLFHSDTPSPPCDYSAELLKHSEGGTVAVVTPRTPIHHPSNTHIHPRYLSASSTRGTLCNTGPAPGVLTMLI